MSKGQNFCVSRDSTLLSYIMEETCFQVELHFGEGKLVLPIDLDMKRKMRLLLSTEKDDIISGFLGNFFVSKHTRIF